MINNNLAFEGFKQKYLPLGFKTKRVSTTGSQNIEAINKLFKRNLKLHEVSYGYTDYGSRDTKEIFTAKKDKFLLSMNLEHGKGDQTLSPLDWESCGITIKDRFTTHHIQQKDIDNNPALLDVILDFMNHVYTVFPNLTKK